MTQPSPPPAPNRINPGRILLMVLFLLIAVPLTIVGIALAPGPLSEAKTVVIPHGTHILEIGTRLGDNGVIRSSLLFRAAVRVLAHDNIKAGEYQFDPSENLANVVIAMRDGRSVIRMFTAPEGLTSDEIVEMLKDNPYVIGEITEMPAEGTLLPESYRYSYGDTRVSLITRMTRAMQDEMNAAWDKRDPAVPLKSPQEALVMASLIEKETGKKEERARIARVFYNRLQQSMRLQSDPTVIYAITKGKGPMDRALTHDDLALASPYNTYTNDGLPPQPICNPGRASIEAALHPEPNDFLYFVADGTGGHVFAKDLATHNQNVNKWTEIKAKEDGEDKAAKPVYR